MGDVQRNLQAAVDRLNILTSGNYWLEKHSGQGTRVVYRVGKGQSNLSPILPRKMLTEWVQAFIQGFELANTLEGKANA